MIDEGYIKFNMEWEQTAPLENEVLKEIIEYRNKCFREKFIGVYPDSGIGYGNISIRHGNDQFIISGTQTGHIPELTKVHFTLVTEADMVNNRVVCTGPVKASAESLTHAIFYRLDPTIMAVIHIHQPKMWQQLKNKVPATSSEIPYGTTDMCEAIQLIYQTSSLPQSKIMVMAGHQDGIISFGKNLGEAYEILINARETTRPFPGNNPDI